LLKGRHVSQESSTFGRDLAVMIVGIGVVGALVFGGLSLVGADEEPAPTTTAPAVPSSTAPTTAATVAPATTAPPPAPATTVPAVRPPSEVRVLVLNSVGTPGLAAAVNADLAELGYVTLTPDNYGPLVDQSRVWYREGFGGEALELASQFPDALVERNEFEAEADIIVVLGASYSR